LAKKAINAGVEIQLLSKITEPILNSGVRGVKYRQSGQKKEVLARLVVDSSGKENAVLGKKLGLLESKPIGINLEKEYFCKELDDPLLCHHGVGSFSPGAYSWTYPTSECSALVGICVRKNPSEFIRVFDAYLKKVFYKRARFPQEVEVHLSTSFLTSVRGTVKDNFLMIGSAAQHRNALWHEGIRFVTGQAKRNAAICAKLLEQDMLSEGDLKACEYNWKKQFRNRKFFNKLEEEGSSISDERWNLILDIIDRMDSRTAYRMLRGDIHPTDFIQYLPQLIVAMGKEKVVKIFN
jgi:flavin-dependent dehydrogenase